jgi:hypothetical protein
MWPTKKAETNTITWMQECLMSSIQIDKQTKIASMGSCFAREIKNWLIKNQFNYIVTENNKMPWESNKIFKGDNVNPNEHASAAWERVYNTFTISHIIDYTFNNNRLNDRLFNIKIKDTPYVSDVLRSRIIYKDMDTARIDVLDHIECSKNVLLNADLLIITLGLTEIWESKERNLVAASNPINYYKLPDDFIFRTSKYQENIDNLNYAYDILKRYNNNLKILVTVSPVHLLSTFRKDIDVISASCESKSILRAVAGEFQNKKDVYYFPSYEIATIISILDGINAYPDNHHISKELVNIIMNIFNKRFIKQA